MTRLTTLILIFLAGCSTYAWRKDGAEITELERDKRECKYEAAKSTASYSVGGGAYRSASAAAARGGSEDVSQVFRESELVDLCLEARGYKYQRAAR